MSPHPVQEGALHGGVGGIPPAPLVPPVPLAPPVPLGSHALPLRVAPLMHSKSHCPVAQTAMALSGGAGQGAHPEAPQPTIGSGSTQLLGDEPADWAAGQHFCPDGQEAPSESHESALAPAVLRAPPVSTIPPLAARPPVFRPPVATPPDPEFSPPPVEVPPPDVTGLASCLSSA